MGRPLDTGHKYSYNGMFYIYLAVGRQGWHPGDRLHQLCVRSPYTKGCSSKETSGVLCQKILQISLKEVNKFLSLKILERIHSQKCTKIPPNVIPKSIKQFPIFQIRSPHGGSI